MAVTVTRTTIGTETEIGIAVTTATMTMVTMGIAGTNAPARIRGLMKGRGTRASISLHANADGALLHREEGARVPPIRGARPRGVIPADERLQPSRPCDKMASSTHTPSAHEPTHATRHSTHRDQLASWPFGPVAAIHTHSREQPEWHWVR